VNFEQERLQFEKKGYTIIKDQLHHFVEAREDIKKLIKLGRKGELQTAEMFNDYPNFSGRYNIGKIKQVFQENLDLSHLKKSFDSVDWRSIYQGVLGANYDDYITTVHRLHVTNQEYKYSSIWHRDEGFDGLTIRSPKVPSSLRINLYFFDEVGFKVIPKDNDYFYESTAHDKELFSTSNPEHYCQTELDIEETIFAKAGDILIFHPELFHRPYCSTFRAHLHIDSVNPKEMPNYTNYGNVEGDLVNLHRHSFKRQMVNLFKYYAPIPSRNYFKFLKEKPSYLKNQFIQRPSVFQKKY
jgi:hypothetical protein